MSLAVISLGALFVAIVLSCTTRLNVGVVSLAMAWIIGVYLGGFRVDEVAAGFPAQLFLTLAGVTLLFTQAQLNGTLNKLANKALLLCRGKAGLVPVVFFLVAAVLASIGPGNIATAALIAPMAMTVGARAGVPAFLMALMVGNGANAGSLSPFAPTGIIVNGLMANIGLPGLEWQAWWTNLLAHATVALAAFAMFGGPRLLKRNYEDSQSSAPNAFDRTNWITLAAIAALIAGVIFFRVHVGMGAFTASCVLAILNCADHSEALKKLPWRVIVMVTGVTVLIALLEKTQGLALFTDLLASLSTKQSVTSTVAFLTGLISVYSSTSGVVLPAFLPTVPGLSSQLAGADPAAIAFSMNVGSHLVDVSPVSTIGALCIAAAPEHVDTRKLFNALLAWGLSMTVVGAAISWIFFRP